MKIIRLWGIIAFFVLTLVLAIVWIFAAPLIIESGIEDTGSEALGAKVEIDDVNLALFPLRIEINGLQAADPDQPMKNLVQADKINFALDTESLLWKKVLIDELTMTGVRLATKRSTSGALDGGRATEKLASKVASFDLPEMNEEDVKKLVSEADLITVKRLNKLNQTQKEVQTFWKSQLNKEESKKRIDDLKIEFDRLSKRAKDNKMNLLTDRKAWKNFKKDVDLERKALSDLNNKLKQDKKDLQEQISLVKQGPQDDLDAIMGNMGLGNGVAGLSDKFLGPQFTPWVEKAIAMTKGMSGKSQPNEEASSYSTSQGQRVNFKDQQVFPDLLIKKMNLSGKDTNWELSGLGKNIGYFPWLIGEPSQLDLDISASGKAKASIKSDWQSEEKMLTEIDSNISDWQLSDMKLMQTKQGSWVINSGKLNSQLQGDLTLEKVNLKLSINLSQPNITPPENLTGWQKTLAASLNQQKQLAITILASGSLTDPKIKVESSIEKLFSAAIGAKVQQQAEKLKDKFSGAISEKAGDLSGLDGKLGDFDQWTDALKGNDELLKKLKPKL